MDINHERQTIERQFEKDLSAVKTEADLERLRIAVLGKKGSLTSIVKRIATAPQEQRPALGEGVNTLKKDIAEALIKKGNELSRTRIEQELKHDRADLTLPSDVRLGHIHPVAQTQRRVEEVFRSMGFMVLDGPELESEYFNFDAVNMPADHPARETQDTFWVEGKGTLMRTQTTSVQVRGMRTYWNNLEQYGAPMRAIVPGRVFRNERTDITHDNTFMQVEGLMVDRAMSIANLIAVMKTMLAQVLERETEVRLRPGFFPFVEPGFELDAKVTIDTPHGKKEKWLELVPCGMVHPVVLKEGGIDPERYSGFAFGLGLDRLTMMRYGINNIRLFLSGDMEFLTQF